ELKNFTHNMGHLGDSYYKSNDKFYMIRNTKHNIICGFKKDKNGEPFLPMKYIQKLRMENLSPYTM
ncbi:6674_t:CDS:1, partial [Gigaspora rosea]